MKTKTEIIAKDDARVFEDSLDDRYCNHETY